MKTIRDIEYFAGVKMLVRVDFNVSIKNGLVVDDFRIRVAMPTIEFLSKNGAIVILMSHLESLDGDKPSLLPVAKHLEKLGQAVTFIKDFKNAHEIVEIWSKEDEGRRMEKGEDNEKGRGVFLLENLRLFEGEKNNDSKFAKELASLADIYVNEAFSVSHREHASVVGLPKFLPSYIGLQFEKEVANLSKAFNPSHPFIFILGGAKFETKLPLVERFSKIADTVFLGGALGNDALAAKGMSVGASKISDGKIDLSTVINQPNVIVPIDLVNQNHIAKDIKDVGETDMILDEGSKTLASIAEKIKEAKFILWNGPLGLYEKCFVEGTNSLAKMIAERTQSEDGVTSIVGGGDTLAAIANLGIEDKFTFVSSGGGAMLDFLAKGSLPGIEAIVENNQ